MADNTRVSGSIKIENTSPEAVAFTLLEKITFYEDSKEVKKDRKYWLTLYRQCYKATMGHELDDILKEG